MRLHLVAMILLLFICRAGALQESTGDSTAYRVQAVSYPDSASVFIDHLLRGYTPFVSRDVDYGPHAIRIVKPGFLDFVDSVTIEPGRPVSLSARLQIPGNLAVSTEPPGASVYLDGRFLGLSPLRVSDLLPGRRKLRATVSDYVDVEYMVVIPEGDTANANLKLISKYGSLSVESDDCEVLVDGTSMGLGSLRNHKIPTGTHIIQVRTPDSLKHVEQKLFIGSGTIVNLKSRMQRTNAAAFLLPGYTQLREGSRVEGWALSIGALTFGTSLAVFAVKYASDLSAYESQRSEYLNTASEESALRAHESLASHYSNLRGQRGRVFLFAGLFAAVVCYNIIDVLLNHDSTTSILEVAQTMSRGFTPMSIAEREDIEWIRVTIRL